MHAKLLSDLTAKKIPSVIPCAETHENALDKLEELYCKATMNSLNIVDFEKPFNIHVDASDYAVGAVVSQTDEKGIEQPTAFTSQKLNKKHLKNVGPIRHCEPPPHCHSPGVTTVARRHCRMPPAHRCPRQQRQHVTEGTAMAP